MVHAVGLTAYLAFESSLPYAAHAAGLPNFDQNPAIGDRTYAEAMREATTDSVYAVVRQLIASKTG